MHEAKGRLKILLPCQKSCIDIFDFSDEAAQVIADITRRMGDGMAKYIQQDVETIADYDEYCHFVAGLVGVGLSQVRCL